MNKIIAKANELDLLGGVWVGRRNQEVEVFHQFFANNTSIFYKLEEGLILRLSCILLCFQVVSDFYINLNKSEMVSLGGWDSDESLASLLGCKMTKFPVKYLGLLLGAKYKNLGTWDSVIETFERRLACWKKNFFLKEVDLLL